MKIKIFDIGINDSNYSVDTVINGKRIICLFYQRWREMIRRGYCAKFKLKWTTYKDVTVCKEWHSFMNFKRWMESQDWEGKQLDKDLLVSGNKVYSPDTCCFINSEINTLLTKSDASRGKYPLWVNFSKSDDKYMSRINYKGKSLYLGLFHDPLLAHQAGQRKKIEIFKEVAETQEDKIKNALLRIYGNIQYELDNNLETKEY